MNVKYGRIKMKKFESGTDEDKFCYTDYDDNGEIILYTGKFNITIN